jgi:hypothetical protein
MGFNAEKFLNAKMQPRTADVPVPGLAHWFPEGEKPIWKVKGISGQELGFAQQSVANRKDIPAIVAGLLGGNSKEKIDATKKALNIDDTIAANDALNIHLVRLGSVDPVIDEDLAVKLCTCHVIELREIAKKILTLTGQGYEPGKA